MRLISTLLISLFSVSVIVAQEDEKPVEISFHGFVSLNAGYNSRTSKQVRNNSIYLYPLPQKLNEDEDDLNARGSFDLGGIEPGTSWRVPVVYSSGSSGAKLLINWVDDGEKKSESFDVQ